MICVTFHLQVFKGSHCFYHLKGSMKELNMFHNYETEKITHKASDMAENLPL